MMKKHILPRLLCFLIVCLFVLSAPMNAHASGQMIDPFQTERMIYTYLTDKMNLPMAAACGILANIEFESNFQPSVLGDGGTSIGLCQWHNERYRLLQQFCISAKLDYKSVSGQLEFLHYDLGTNYSELYGYLKSMDNTRDNAYRAAYAWCTMYERPADTEEQANARGRYAKLKYWPRYEHIELIDSSHSTEVPDFPLVMPQNEDVVMATAPASVTVKITPDNYYAVMLFRDMTSIRELDLLVPYRCRHISPFFGRQFFPGPELSTTHEQKSSYEYFGAFLIFLVVACTDPLFYLIRKKYHLSPAFSSPSIG